MKKLLIYALVFGLAFTPTFGWASSVLFAGGQGQQVVYRGTVTGLRISALDGVAFLDNLPSAVTDLVTASPGVYGIEVYDSSGRMLKGVLKAVGTGETVGSEILDDVTFDDDSKWTKGTGWTVSGGKGVAASAGDSTISQTKSRTLYALYKAVVVCDSYTAGTFTGMLAGNYGMSNATSATTLTTYATNKNTGATGAFGIYAGTALTATFTDLSLKQVLTPSTAGVTIVSAKGGTTYNWQFKHASFTYNQSTNYVILKKLR